MSLIQKQNLISDRVRLGILTYLIKAKRKVEFNELLKELELTKGNLSSHLKKLEEANYIIATKEFINRIPKTSYLISKTGEAEFYLYLDELEAMLKFIKQD